MKKIGVNFLILNLVLSIFAICFLISLTNIEIVSAYKTPSGYTDFNKDGFFGNENGLYWDSKTNQYWKEQGGEMVEIDASGNLLDMSTDQQLLSTTPSPVAPASLGYGGQIAGSFTKNMGQAGTVWDGKNWISSTSDAGKEILKTNPEAFQSGGGYSAGGILQGVMWAGMVAIAVQTFAPMFGADSDLTNTLTASLSV